MNKGTTVGYFWWLTSVSKEFSKFLNVKSSLVTDFMKLTFGEVVISLGWPMYKTL